jgi:hypothetical protein
MPLEKRVPYLTSMTIIMAAGIDRVSGINVIEIHYNLIYKGNVFYRSSVVLSD